MKGLSPRKTHCFKMAFRWDCHAACPLERNPYARFKPLPLPRPLITGWCPRQPVQAGRPCHLLTQQVACPGYPKGRGQSPLYGEPSSTVAPSKSAWGHDQTAGTLGGNHPVQAYAGMTIAGDRRPKPAVTVCRRDLRVRKTHRFRSSWSLHV